MHDITIKIIDAVYLVVYFQTLILINIMTSPLSVLRR